MRNGLRFLKVPPSLALVDVQRSKILSVVQNLDNNALILNIGSKDTGVGTRVFNVDVVPYRNVHLVCDGQMLSIRDSSVDAVFAIALLEIVEKPSAVVSEIYRVLKPGGVVLASTPFLQGYHPDPVDTHRFTIHGARLLFKEFTINEIVPTRGVFNSFLCILHGYLAVLLSFNSICLWKILNILLAWILFPFKYIDRIMPHYKKYEYVSSSFLITARKPSKP